MDYRSLKGQSAIEYLMTYGWMLLVVAVVGGSIFSVAQGDTPDKINGFSASDVRVTDFGVTSTERLQLNLRDGSGRGIAVTRVNISDSDTGDYVFKEFSGDTQIDVGSSKIFELPNVTRSSSGNILNVQIRYNSGGLTNLTRSGTISGDLALDGVVEVSGSTDSEDDSADINQNLLIESFESGNLDNYSGNKSYFDVVSGGVNESNALRITHPSYVEHNDYIWRNESDQIFSKGQSLRFWSNTTTAHYEGLTFGLESVNSGYKVGIYPGADYLRLDRVDNGSDTELVGRSQTFSNPHFAEVKWENDGNITVKLYESSQYQTVNASISAIDNTYSGDIIGWYVQGPAYYGETAMYDYARAVD